MEDLALAVDAVVNRCLGVRPGEDVLLIVDRTTRGIGEALQEEVRKAHADAVLALMDERAEHGAEPARPIAGALLACDAFVAPTAKSISHTRARERATEAGARGATMPGVTEEMLARVMAVDFERMRRRSHALATALSAGGVARLSCPRGTALTLELTGRRGIADDGDLTQPGAFGNLPCGEGFIAPVSGEGVIVATSVGGLGLSDPPATLTVDGGRLRSASGGLGPALKSRLEAHGDAGANLAELGVGTNDSARLTGNMLEDEKILGTAHVAFGASAAIGGTVAVPVHLDVVVLDASLEIDGRPVLDAGRYVLEGG